MTNKPYYPKRGDKFNAISRRYNKPHPCNPMKCTVYRSNQTEATDGDDGTKWVFDHADWRFEKKEKRHD